MFRIDFNTPIHVHFIGIGGISMSGLAEILLDKGFTVSGSDAHASELTDELEAKGALFNEGQRASNITDDIDLVVYTAAIRANNPEYAEVVKRGLPMLTRAELLGQLMQNYAMPIAVSGTHGKTTTTSMLSEILLAEQVDPTLSIGGILKSIKGNIRIGHSQYFVTEACEYTNSFLSFYPRMALILNIEEDHLDFFKNLEDIRASFRRFADLLPADGTLIINHELERLPEFLEGLGCKVVTFGCTEGSDYRIGEVTFDEMGCGQFTLTMPNDRSIRLALKTPGIHNCMNAAAAAATADLLGVSSENIIRALNDFTGADRRFEYKGKIGEVTIVDDYAHHPTEITSALTAAQKIRHNTLWTVFQPHTYTRTKALFGDFVEALSLSDKVVMAPIYPARETDTLGMDSKLIADALEAKGVTAYSFPTFDEIENFLLLNCVPGDMIITMGAGDVVRIGEKLLGK